MWPPGELAGCSADRVDLDSIQHVLFIAGGVGINPLMAMIRHFEAMEKFPPKVTFFYATKVPEIQQAVEARDVLFLQDLLDIQKRFAKVFSVKPFLTGELEKRHLSRELEQFDKRRFTEKDLLYALGEDLKSTVCYICGPPAMTDEFVSFLTSREGMDTQRVLCEKWW